MADHFDPYHVWLGIPPEEQPPNHYRLLGLRALEDDREVISNALDQRLAFLRTFQAGKRSALSQKLLNEVSAAGVVLLNSEKKAQYDRTLGPREAGSSASVRFPTAAAVPVSPAQSFGAESLPMARPITPQIAPPQSLRAPEIIPAFVAAPARPRTVPAQRHTESANPHLFPLLAAAVGLVGLAGLAIGGWWLFNQPGRPVDPVAPIVQQGDGGGSKITAGGTDTVGPAQSQKIETPVSAADKQIWLADAPVQRVFRRVGSHWIDYRERSEDWYEPGPTSARSVRLSDAVRRISIELFDDRAEVSHANSAPAVVATGRWISAADLPPFAKRPPATKAPDPLRFRSSFWHALVLDGNSSISLPLPAEIARPGADFTIEMWARFDARHPDSRLILAEPLQLHTLRPRLEVGGPPSMLMADLKSGPLGLAVRPPVIADRWHHWAIVRAGPQLRLFIDGQPRAALPLDKEYAIRAPNLLLGGRGTAQEPNLRGMIREVRVSGVARYSQSFRPPLRLVKDDQTLLLPKFEGASGNMLEDLSGRGHHGSRGTAQWLPLSPDEGIVQAELPADHVDLERAFLASIHTLRGTTEGNPAYHDTTSAQGICQMLVPYQPQGDYDLEFQVERLEGEGGLVVGLVIGEESTQLALGVNAFADQGGPYTGILSADLQSVAPTARLVKHEPRLRTGQQQQVVVRLRNTGLLRYSLEVLIDGQSVCNFSDAVSNSSLSPALRLPQQAALFWGSHNAKIRYHALRLYPAGKAPTQGTLASRGAAEKGSSARLSPTPASTDPAAPSAKAALAGKAWLADEPEQCAIRLVGGRWVEFRERDEFWYNLREASPVEYLLADNVRKVDLRLRDGEVAIRTPLQDWATLGPGRWVDAAELPAFAQRPLAAAPSDPAKFREPVWHALMFDGRSALRMSLPPELAAENSDFTAEAWLRFDPWQSPDLMRVLSVGPLAVSLAPAAGSGSSGKSADQCELHLLIAGEVRRIPVAVSADRWLHLALVRQGSELRLYQGGQPFASVTLPNDFALSGPPQSLVFGQFGGGTSEGFLGMLRDFRVSKVARYAAPFTPPLRCLSDNDTLVLPKFLADPQPIVQNLAPTGSRITRDKAQWVTLSHWGDLAGLRPGGLLDLTRLYSVTNHTLMGKFVRTSAYTDSLMRAGLSLVLIPYRPPADYDIELEATRLEGEGGVLLGLMLGEKQALLGLDLSTPLGRRTGILPADLPQIARQTDLTSHQELLATGQRRRFVIKVRQPTSDTYSIDVSQSGNDRIATIQGKIAELGAFSEWTSRSATGMCLGSLDARMRFHSLVLTPSGSLGASTASNSPAGVVPPTRVTPSVTISPSPPKRRAVPSPEELAERLASARQAFEAEFQSATKPAQKAVLARHILTAADNSKSDITARYVLVDLARKVFIQAGEVNDALAAARTLEKEFDIPEDQLVIESLEALDELTMPSEQRTIMARVAIDLADDWLAADEFDLVQFAQAEKLATIASQSAGKQKDAELRKEIVQRRNQIMRVVTSAKAVQSSLTVLETKPDDPAANLAVGKFRCFVQEEWAEGLPNLAKGGDPLFAGPAALDLATSSRKPADLAAAGESWLKLAADNKTIDRDDRPAIQRRAKEHLTAALPGLTGLESLRIQRRLDEIKDVAAPAPKRPARSRAPRGTGLSGLIGRVVVRGQDAGIVVTYLPGYTVTPEDVQNLAAIAGAAPGDAIRIEFLGILSLAIDSQVELKHVGGSSSGGVHTLFIGGQSVSEIGDDRSKDDTRQLPLLKGQHILRWTLTGGDLGTARLSLVPVDATGKPQEGVAQIQFTRDMNVFAHSVPYKHELRWANP
jgi:hypothetical protein